MSCCWAALGHMSFIFLVFSFLLVLCCSRGGPMATMYQHTTPSPTIHQPERSIYWAGGGLSRRRWVSSKNVTLTIVIILLWHQRTNVNKCTKYKHTHTHMNTHARTHVHAHTHTLTHSHTHTHTPHSFLTCKSLCSRMPASSIHVSMSSSVLSVTFFKWLWFKQGLH